MLHCALGGSEIRQMTDRADQLRAEIGPENVFDFTIGNPLVAPPAVYLDTLKEQAQINEGNCHGYSDNEGEPGARQAVADLFSAAQDIKVGPEHVVMTSGCSGAINVTIRSVVCPFDEVIIFSPFFVEYPYYIENFCGRVREVETTFEDGWQINIDKLRRAISPCTRMVMVNSPNNPTGVVYSQECVDHIAELLTEKSEEYGRPIYFLSDDVYFRVCAPGFAPHKIFNKYVYTVITWSLSKDCAIPGERVGAIVVNPRIEGSRTLIAAMGHNNMCLGFVHTNRLQMRVVPALLKSGQTSDLSEYDRAREIICDMLDELKVPYVKPEGAVYIFPKVPDGVDDFDDCKHMANHRIVIVPGSGFHTPGFYRLSFCRPAADIARAVPVFKAAHAAVLAELGK
jgi:aspartate aminotransferase